MHYIDAGVSSEFAGPPVRPKLVVSFATQWLLPIAILVLIFTCSLRHLNLYFFWNLPYLDFGFVFTSVVLMLVLMLVLMKVLMLVLKLAPMLVLAGTDAGDVGGVPEIRCPVIINKTHDAMGRPFRFGRFDKRA